MVVETRGKPEYFDVDYGIPSPIMSADGVVAVVTGSANYHGFTLIAGTSIATAVIYDSVSTSAGNVIDIIQVGVTQMSQSRDIRVRARLGISVSMTGTDMQGVIFYSPQG